MKELNLAGIKLWLQKANTADCIARVIIVHGGNEHSGRHQRTIKYLNSIGVESISFDLKGHGRNRASFISLDDLANDLGKVFDWAKKSLDPKPTFLFGHSMGAAISLIFLHKNSPSDLQGLILTSPSLKEGSAISTIHILAVKVLIRLFPKLELPDVFSSDCISTMREEVARYNADPLVRHKTYIQMAADLLDTSKKAPEMMKALEVPLFLGLGSRDTIINTESCVELFNICGSQNKTLRIYEGSRHEIHHDFRAKELFSDIAEWIKNQAGVAKTVDKDQITK